MEKIKILYKNQLYFRYVSNLSVFFGLLIIISSLNFLLIPYVMLLLVYLTEGWIDTLYYGFLIAWISILVLALIDSINDVCKLNERFHTFVMSFFYNTFIVLYLFSILQSIYDVSLYFKSNEVLELTNWVVILYANTLMIMIYTIITFSYMLYSDIFLQKVQHIIESDVYFGEDFQLQYNTMIISQEDELMNTRKYKFDSKQLKYQCKLNELNTPSCTSVLLISSLIKVTLIYYFLCHIKQIPFDRYLIDRLIVTFTIGTYNNSIMSLFLSNEDLIQKIKTICYLSDCLSFKQSDERDLYKNLDVTCPISLETWDNIRRTEYESNKGQRENVEYTYVVTFLFLLFTLMVVIEGYFDIYLVFDKDSFFLEPLNLLCISIDFILFCFIILYRVYFIDYFNNTFSNCSHQLDTLIGEFEDLEQLFDLHFIYSGVSSNLITSECNCKEVPLKALIISKLKHKAEEICLQQTSLQDIILNQDFLERNTIEDFRDKSKEIIYKHIDIINRFAEFFELYSSQEEDNQHNPQTCAEGINCQDCIQVEWIAKITFMISEMTSKREQNELYTLSEVQFFYSFTFFIDKSYYERYEQDQIVIQYFFKFLYERYLSICSQEFQLDNTIYTDSTKIQSILIKTFKIDKTNEQDIFEDIEMNANNNSNSNEYELKLCPNNKISLNSCYQFFIEYMKRAKKSELVYKDKINIILMSLRRINSQIESDSKSQKQKAFQILDVNFKELVITLFIGFLTILPQVWTKLHDMFSIPQK